LLHPVERVPRGTQQPGFYHPIREHLYAYWLLNKSLRENSITSATAKELNTLNLHTSHVPRGVQQQQHSQTPLIPNSNFTYTSLIVTPPKKKREKKLLAHIFNSSNFSSPTFLRLPR
jgi:hypothetical protein